MSAQLIEIEVRFTAGPDTSYTVGALVERRGRIFFEYSSAWIQRNLELSPFHLPVRPGLFEHRNREFGPLFGLFDDSLPDGWGLLLMDRHFRKLGRDPASLSPLDRLLYLGHRTMGALTYHPPAVPRNSHNALLDLQELARQSQEIYSGKTIEVLPLLLRAGGSPGGARPKVLVGYNPGTKVVISGEDDLPVDFEPWIVKFAAREDALDAGPIEYAYSLMARAAGIEMPETRLFTTEQGNSFFGVKRFDRKPGNRRLHIHTFGNLIQANFRIPACDYGDLLKVTTLLTRKHADLLRAFRFMVFNVFGRNRDDHVKNFSFLLDDQTGEWTLAPAYDLTFAAGPGGEHTTSIAGEGRTPTRKHLHQLADQHGVSSTQADEIISEVAASVHRWKELAAEAGVSQKKITEISSKLQAVDLNE